MVWVLVLFPMFAGAAAMALKNNRYRPWLLPAVGTVHLPAAGLAVFGPAQSYWGGWLTLDAPGRIVMCLVSSLFFLSTWYVAGYLRHRQERSNRVFCACLLASLGTMSLVAWSQHLGLMWVAIEATTLACAPLIYFNRTPRSIEATWKYLLVGSVGVALALLGSFFLGYASLHAGMGSSLLFDDLLRAAPHMSQPWLKAAFVFLLVGYGTKMGLAPMHTWKPDAYGEAPGVVGAILAGGVTSCAFLALLRVFHICKSAGAGDTAAHMLVVLGLLSMATAAVFMMRQRDLKRMLAYSSVEHMGILAVGLGLGGTATYGALLHVLANGLTKGALFLSIGNIHRAYGSKFTTDVRGAWARLPVSAILLVGGFLAITGSPPFVPFVSEFTIVRAAMGQGRFVVAGLFLLLLLVVFIGMGSTVLRAVQGRPTAAPDPVDGPSPAYRDGLLTGLPAAAFLILVLVLGVNLPAPVAQMIADAAAFLEP